MTRDDVSAETPEIQAIIDRAVAKKLGRWRDQVLSTLLTDLTDLRALVSKIADKLQVNRDE